MSHISNAMEQSKELINSTSSYICERPVLYYGVISCSSIYVFGKFFQHFIQNRLFAGIMSNLAETLKTKESIATKEKLFSTLKSSKNENNKLKILEIGVGSGTNFSFYPDNTHLIVVDPNKHFKYFYDKNRAQFKNIKSEEIIVAKGEEMDMVASSSVDAVVATLVLCSVDDEAKVFQQVLRVLKPGGKFIFLEHIFEWDYINHSCRRFFQFFLTAFGIWPRIFCNCNLNRNPVPLLSKAGFSNISHNFFYAPTGLSLYLIRPHVTGVAVK